MSIPPIAFYSGMLVVGIVMLMIGRTMNTHAEEEWKGEYWWREMIYGPPGHHRASTLITGIVLIVAGMIGVLYTLFFP